MKWKTSMVAVLAVLGAAAEKPAVTNPTELAALEWILGKWEKPGQRSTVREDWKQVSPKTFEGVGYALAPDGRKRINETLRIVEMGGEIFYLAKVGQNPLPIAFKLVGAGANEAVFENPKHDFPRKITYRRKGDHMTAVVEGAKTGSGFTLQFRRVKAE